MPLRLSFRRLSVFQQPLLFVAAAFIGGMLVARAWAVSLAAWMAIAAFCWMAALAGIRLKSWGAVVVVLLLTGSFAAGGGLWLLNRAGVGGDRVRRLVERGELKLDEPVEVWGRLNLSPELAPDRIYLSLEVERIAVFGREEPAAGLIQLVVPFNDYESRVEYDRLALDYGMRVRLWCYLSNRRGYRNPGAPDFDEILEDHGYDATGWVKSPLLIEPVGAGRRSLLLSTLYRLRGRALTAVLRDLRQPAAGILAASLFGNRYFLARDTAERFRAGGTFHLLVISGLHVALIALAALWIVKLLVRSRWIQFAAVLVLVWGYTLMVGAEPSITRAAVMLSLALIGQSIFRVSHGPNLLAASALALLAWQPRDLFNPAFQLSFLTVLMVVVIIGPLYLRFKRIGQWRPSALTPYPPRVPSPIRRGAEILFWNEAAFRREMKESRIRYRLDKSRLARRLGRWRVQAPLAWIVLTILTTTAVQVGLLPLMISRFHRISIISPITNVIESALLFALMVGGALYLMVRAVLGELASKLAPAVNALGLLTVKSCDSLRAWRHASWRVPDLAPSLGWAWVCYWGAVLVLMILIDEWNPFRRGDEPGAAGRRAIGRWMVLIASCTLVVLGGLSAVSPFQHRYERGRLSITFLDVGQGDAMLIDFPRGASLMLDAGGHPSFSARSESGEDEEPFVEDRLGIAEAAVMPFLWSRGIRRLDWILASHGDTDHVEGFGGIVESFEIGGALKGPGAASPNLFERTIAGSRLPVRVLTRGDAFEIDGARVEVLAPFPEARGFKRSSNNDSVVLKITFGERRFLLTGDIEKETEGLLMAAGTDLRADVLKVAHHGSRTSSTAEFMKRVQPSHVVISVANPSPYRHPHPEVIERLRQWTREIWKTSDCGAITISTDGRELRTETFVKCR
ncbi:MAG TPA: ComEC/Rec2 family competence protein [Blastocatellia bacterium]|nr:ComEC/Rec2 family competence protein [Blastocatellia bacterium]